ncbi:MAG: IS200/IS605 family transposase [Actinomycetota bacterium]|nr:IS200/IS605 family transposase [Actinomycetota bacterium]
MSDLRFRRSAGGVTSLGLHVFGARSTANECLATGLHSGSNEALDEIAADNDWQIVAGEVMPDPLDIFVRVRPAGSPGEVARKFKGRTSRVLRGEFAWLGCGRVLWSKSYFAASVGYVSGATVGRYIEHQWDVVA